MKIAYDQNLKIAGVGMVPWRRLGPEQWFPHYAIASLYDSGEADCGPRVVSLSSKKAPVHLPRRNTRTLLADKQFQARINTELPGYDLMLYRATKIPKELAGRKFIMPDTALAKTYENKVLFRQKLSTVVPFAPFTILARHELEANEAAYEALSAAHIRGMVLQDATLSGGQGTYLVRDFVSYRRAAAALGQHHDNDNPVVVSDLIADAKELSIQACVTHSGVYTGPLQRQIIRNPVLSLDVPGASSFCGIQILATDQGSELHDRVTAIAQQIGTLLQVEGYRGIFGVDLLQAPDGSVYVLEVNPRITGATPLLSALYRGEEGVPFYLLHILELGGYDYDITDKTAAFAKDGALLVVHSLQHETVTVGSLLAAGTYRIVNGELGYVSNQLLLSKLAADEFIVLPQTQVGETVPPGGMLLSLQFNHVAIDINRDKLYNDVTNIVSAVRRKIY
jgi:hypothetical protein